MYNKKVPREKKETEVEKRDRTSAGYITYESIDKKSKKWEEER
jgi:hypothetical protein